MGALRIFRARVRALFRRDAIAGEIRDELQFHFESRAEQLEREGMTPPEARREARRRVGNLALYQDRGYDVRGGGLMETIWQDVRYALRLLRKQPGFTTVAVLTLALGIGASTAIFSVIDAAILRPLPYPHPEQLVDIDVGLPGRDSAEISYYGTSIADMNRWQGANSPFSALATWRNVMFGRVMDGPEPERVSAIEVSDQFLRLHGIAPLIGRDFSAGDTQAGAPLVALLGYGYWQRRFGGDLNVVGQSLRFDGTSATIVGVLPATAEAIPVWLPLRVAPSDIDRRGTGRSTYGRLREGVSIADAEQRMTAALDNVPMPDGSHVRPRVRLTSLLEDTVHDYATTVEILGGAVAVILLIAAVNVAGLLLARGATRHTELAVRASIGAGRWRLMRQLLVESLVLAATGGGLGVLVAWLSLDALVANIPVSLRSNAPAALNLEVLGASAGLTMLIGILFGLLPAFRLSRVPVRAALASGGRGHASTLSRRGGQWLIGAEIALAVILVIGAGLMIRSFSRILGVDLGFDPDRIVTLEATPLDQDPAAQARFYPAVVEAVRALPGVAAAGAVDNFALGGSNTVTMAMVDGQSKGISLRRMTPGYLEALGLSARQGQLPKAGDPAAAQQAIVNETGARELFGGAPAIGRQLTVSKQTYTIAGVVPDLRHNGPFGRVRGEIFLPFAGNDDALSRARAMTVVVRPTGTSADLADRLKRAAQSAGPRVLVERIRTGPEWLGVNVATPRRRTVLLGLLGALGLVLAIVGVSGMTAYSVSRRTQEIGVRMAFGASGGQIVARMLRDSAVPILIGTIAGIGGAALATRVIKSFLFQTDPIDAPTFAAVAVILIAAGCAAAWIPARRAARVDPVTALRE